MDAPQCWTLFTASTAAKIHRLLLSIAIQRNLCGASPLQYARAVPASKLVVAATTLPLVAVVPALVDVVALLGIRDALPVGAVEVALRADPHV